MYRGILAKYPLFLSDFNGACNFYTDFRKNTLIQNCIEIRPVGADGPTDMTKPIITFRNFYNVPKKADF